MDMNKRRIISAAACCVARWEESFTFEIPVLSELILRNI